MVRRTLPSRSVLPLKEVLERVVRSLGIDADLRAHAVGPAWPRAAGPLLAAHTRAVRLHHGTLHVEARSAVWMNEASMLRETLVRRINEELGTDRVRDIRLRMVGFAPTNVVREPEPEPGLLPSAAEIEVARRELLTAGGLGSDLAARAMALQRKSRK